MFSQVHHTKCRMFNVQNVHKTSNKMCRIMFNTFTTRCLVEYCLYLSKLNELIAEENLISLSRSTATRPHSITTASSSTYLHCSLCKAVTDLKNQTGRKYSTWTLVACFHSLTPMLTSIRYTYTVFCELHTSHRAKQWTRIKRRK